MLEQLSPPKERNNDRYDNGQAEALLDEMNRLPDGDLRRERVRAEIVGLFMPFARNISRRYARRGGEPLEDIEQAACLGLVKAINKYDAERCDRFIAYASPMMIGEVKRHFRDKTWVVSVPRRLQELRLAMNRTSQDFVREHCRSPTTSEIAAVLDITEDEAIEAVAAAEAYRPESMDAPRTDDDNTDVLGRHVGEEDPGFDALIDGEAVRPLIDQLSERSRRIVLLRFFGNKTQSQIAEEIGISQMHVSRLLSQSLRELRAGLLTDG